MTDQQDISPARRRVLQRLRRQPMSTEATAPPGGTSPNVPPMSPARRRVMERLSGSGEISPARQRVMQRLYGDSAQGPPPSQFPFPQPELGIAGGMYQSAIDAIDPRGQGATGLERAQISPDQTLGDFLWEDEGLGRFDPRGPTVSFKQWQQLAEKNPALAHAMAELRAEMARSETRHGAYYGSQEPSQGLYAEEIRLLADPHMDTAREQLEEEAKAAELARREEMARTPFNPMSPGPVFTRPRGDVSRETTDDEVLARAIKLSEGERVYGQHQPPLTEEGIAELLTGAQQAAAAGRLEEFRQQHPILESIASASGGLSGFIGAHGLLRGTTRAALGALGRAGPAGARVAAGAEKLTKALPPGARGAAQIGATDLALQAARVQAGSQEEIDPAEAVFQSLVGAVGGAMSARSFNKTVDRIIAKHGPNSKEGLEAILGIVPKVSQAKAQAVGFGTMGLVGKARELLESQSARKEWQDKPVQSLFKEGLTLLAEMGTAAAMHRAAPLRQPQDVVLKERLQNFQERLKRINEEVAQVERIAETLGPEGKVTVRQPTAGKVTRTGTKPKQTTVTPGQKTMEKAPAERPLEALTLSEQQTAQASNTAAKKAQRAVQKAHRGAKPAVQAELKKSAQAKTPQAAQEALSKAHEKAIKAQDTKAAAKVMDAQASQPGTKAAPRGSRERAAVELLRNAKELYVLDSKGRLRPLGKERMESMATKLEAGRSKLSKRQKKLRMSPEGEVFVTIDGKRLKLVGEKGRTRFQAAFDELFRKDPRRGAIDVGTAESVAAARESRVAREQAHDRAVDRAMDRFHLLGTPIAVMEKLGLPKATARRWKSYVGFDPDPQRRRLFRGLERDKQRLMSEYRDLRQLTEDFLESVPGSKYLSRDMFRLIDQGQEIRPQDYGESVARRAAQITQQWQRWATRNGRELHRMGRLTDETLKKYEGQYAHHKFSSKRARRDAAFASAFMELARTGQMADVAMAMSPKPVRQALTSSLRKRKITDIEEARGKGLIESMDVVMDSTAQQARAVQMLQFYESIAANKHFVREKDPTPDVRAVHAQKLKTLRALKRKMKREGVSLDKDFLLDPRRELPTWRAKAIFREKLAQLEEAGLERKGLPKGVDPKSDEAKGIQKLQRQVNSWEKKAKLKAAPDDVQKSYTAAHAKLSKEVADLEFHMQGWKELKGKEWGALEGKWIRNDLLQEVIHVHPEMTAFQQALNAALISAKSAQTAMSPVSHINNTLGGPIVNSFGGLRFSDPKAWRQYGLSAKYIIEELVMGKKVNDPVWRRFIDEGFAEAVMATVELNRALGKSSLERLEIARKKFESGQPGGLMDMMAAVFIGLHDTMRRLPVIADKKTKKGTKVPGLLSMYGYEDVLNAFALYRGLSTGEGSARGKMSPEAVFEQVSSMYSYADLPPIWKGYLGRKGLFPFASWPVKMIGALPRSAMKRGLGIPGTSINWRPTTWAGSAASVAWQFSKWALIAQGWNQLAREMGGYTDAEYERFKKARGFSNPLEQQFAILLPFRDKKNNPLWVDMAGPIPFLQLDKMATSAGRRDPTFPIVGRMPASIMRQNFFSAAFLEALTGRTWLGGKREGWGKAVPFAKPFVPGLIMRPSELLYSKAQGYTEMSYLDIIARSLLGIKTRAANQALVDAVLKYEAIEDGRATYREFLQPDPDIIDPELDQVFRRSKLRRKLHRLKKGEF